jgi:hypothetical protein
VRSPVPVMTITIGLPAAQPGSSMISWITPARSGVRWSAPAAPTLVHGTGDHATEAAVTGRDVMSPLVPLKVAGEPDAWPRITRSVAPLSV